jgi:hypothetical protein
MLRMSQQASLTHQLLWELHTPAQQHRADKASTFTTHCRRRNLLQHHQRKSRRRRRVKPLPYPHPHPRLPRRRDPQHVLQPHCLLSRQHPHQLIHRQLNRQPHHRRRTLQPWGKVGAVERRERRERRGKVEQPPQQLQQPQRSPRRQRQPTLKRAREKARAMPRDQPPDPGRRAAARDPQVRGPLRGPRARKLVEINPPNRRSRRYLSLSGAPLPY